MTVAGIPKKLPGTFDGLAGVMVPHAIEDEADYGVVSAMVDRLAVMERRTAGQERYLETLSQLIEAYDRERHPVDTSGVSGVRVLRSLLEDHGMNASDLGRLLGNRALGSKVLNGSRELSKSHMKKLAERFKVSPAVFLR